MTGRYSIKLQAVCNICANLGFVDFKNLPTELDTSQGCGSFRIPGLSDAMSWFVRGSTGRREAAAGENFGKRRACVSKNRNGCCSGSTHFR